MVLREAPAFRAACARMQETVEGDFAAAHAYAAAFEAHRPLHDFGLLPAAQPRL